MFSRFLSKLWEVCPNHSIVPTVYFTSDFFTGIPGIIKKSNMDLTTTNCKSLDFFNRVIILIALCLSALCLRMLIRYS